MYLRWRRESVLAELILLLLIAQLGAFLAFTVQHTGWPYQRFPADALKRLALLLFGIDLFWMPLRRSLGVGRAVVATGLLLYSAWNIRQLGHSRPTLGTPDRSAIEAMLIGMNPGDAVTVLSMSGISMSDIEAHGLEVGSRFLQLWMLPAIVQNERSTS